MFCVFCGDQQEAPAIIPTISPSAGDSTRAAHSAPEPSRTRPQDGECPRNTRRRRRQVALQPYFDYRGVEISIRLPSTQPAGAALSVCTADANRARRPLTLAGKLHVDGGGAAPHCARQVRRDSRDKKPKMNCARRRRHPCPHPSTEVEPTPPRRRWRRGFCGAHSAAGRSTCASLWMRRGRYRRLRCCLRGHAALCPRDRVDRLTPSPNIQPIRRRSTAVFGKRVPQAAAGASRRPVRGAALVTRAARDYYDVLGVSKAADGKELKRAYRAAVRPRHALPSIPP